MERIESFALELPLTPVGWGWDWGCSDLCTAENATVQEYVRPRPRLRGVVISQVLSLWGFRWNCSDLEGTRGHTGPMIRRARPMLLRLQPRVPRKEKELFSSRASY